MPARSEEVPCSACGIFNDQRDVANLSVGKIVFHLIREVNFLKLRFVGLCMQRGDFRLRD